MNFFKFLVLFFLIPCISENLYAQTNDVTLKWEDNRTVLIHIGEESFPMQAGGERVISLPIDDALIIKVETPQSSYTAESFLLIDDRSNAALTVWLNGSEVQFEYGSEGELNRNRPPSTPEVAEGTEIVTAVNSTSSSVEQTESENRTEKNTVFGNWGFMLYETDPGTGFSTSMINLGSYGHNLKEHRLDNSSIFHAFAVDMNSGIYMLDEGPFSFNSMNFDLGLGYGAVFGNKILTAATINLPLIIYSWTTSTAGSFESDSQTQWFVTDAAYLRLQSSWSPFIDSNSWFKGLSFNASWDAALSGNGGSRFNIGIGISDFRLR